MLWFTLRGSVVYCEGIPYWRVHDYWLIPLRTVPQNASYYSPLEGHLFHGISLRKVLLSILSTIPLIFLASLPLHSHIIHLFFHSFCFSLIFTTPHTSTAFFSSFHLLFIPHHHPLAHFHFPLRLGLPHLHFPLPPPSPSPPPPSPHPLHLKSTSDGIFAFEHLGWHGLP